ncbi:hypothetical protein ALC60_00558 [Trachymyrmex zeteki]|uniref:Uncharacterized protein n=1 Tax=Mycetomoellerius zeteki TaxID=64791 RepID=A0A151XIB7_9HYME|nr:hypothetical protein ALC60_00558 [Trachymyrmex zeteki]
MNPARFPICSSLSLSLSLPLYLLTRRQLSPVGFDPRGVYDLPVQSAFFRRFLREPCEIYLGRFYYFMPSCAGRGVPSDASITGSELHPGSLRTGPIVSREERRRLKRKREAKQTDMRYGQSVLHRGMALRGTARVCETRRLLMPATRARIHLILYLSRAHLARVAYVRVDSSSSSTHTDLWKGSVKASRRVHRREDLREAIFPRRGAAAMDASEERGLARTRPLFSTQGREQLLLYRHSIVIPIDLLNLTDKFRSTWIFIVATATLTERTLLILLLSGVLAFMAVLLKTISIPSRDTHFLSPFFQLHLFLPLSGITSQIVSSRGEDEARGSRYISARNFYCCH